MGGLDATLGALGGHAFGTGAISKGAIPRPGGVAAPLFLGDPVGDYAGRVGVAVPSGAAKLPLPIGGTPPVTYSVTNLPAGVTQVNGILVGNPTTARSGTAADVTITASDAAGTSISKTFNFLIRAANAAMTLKDFALRGYHANEFTGIVYAAVYQSGIELLASNTSRNIWSVRSGEEIGATITDPEEDLAFGPYNTFINRMRWNSGEDWVLNHSNTDKDGNAVTTYNFNQWDDAEGQGKKVYIGKRDGTFISADVGDPSGDGRWVAGTVWCRWEFTVGQSRHNFLDAIGVNEYFGFMIAD